MKIYDSTVSVEGGNPDKKIFQDFSFRLPGTSSSNVPFDLSINAVADNDQSNP